MPFNSLYRCQTFLAQIMPMNDERETPPPPPPAHHPLSFTDLQQGLRSANQGNPHDRSTQTALIGMVAVVVLIGVILHLRQRHKQAGAPNSTKRLAWELSRRITFPFGSRILLVWVARTAKVPMATLLVSARAFDAAIVTWAGRPLFGPLRRWGQGRLMQLKPVLFE